MLMWHDAMRCCGLLTSVLRAVLAVCHPEDRGAFMDAVQTAHANQSGPGGPHLSYLHRNLTATGGTSASLVISH